MKTIYLFVSNDNFIYGYHTEIIEGDFVRVFNVDDNFHEFYLQNSGKLYFKDNKIVVKTTTKNDIIQKINDLRTQLGDTDYKIIKNYELLATGLQPEYPVAELHAQRQAWRDEINELEFELAGLQ